MSTYTTFYVNYFNKIPDYFQITGLNTINRVLGGGDWNGWMGGHNDYKLMRTPRIQNSFSWTDDDVN